MNSEEFFLEKLKREGERKTDRTFSHQENRKKRDNSQQFIIKRYKYKRDN